MQTPAAATLGDGRAIQPVRHVALRRQAPSQLSEFGGLQDKDVCCTARQDQVAFTVRFVRRGTSYAGVSVAPLLTEPGVPVQSRCPAGEVRETTTDTASSPKAAIGAACTSGLYQRIDEGSNGEALRRDSLQPFRPSPSKLPSLSWPWDSRMDGLRWY